MWPSMRARYQFFTPTFAKLPFQPFIRPNFCYSNFKILLISDKTTDTAVYMAVIIITIWLNVIFIKKKTLLTFLKERGCYKQSAPTLAATGLYKLSFITKEKFFLLEFGETDGPHLPPSVLLVWIFPFENIEDIGQN